MRIKFLYVKEEWKYDKDTKLIEIKNVASLMGASDRSSKCANVVNEKDITFDYELVFKDKKSENELRDYIIEIGCKASTFDDKLNDGNKGCIILIEEPGREGYNYEVVYPHNKSERIFDNMNIKRAISHLFTKLCEIESLIIRRDNKVLELTNIERTGQNRFKSDLKYNILGDENKYEAEFVMKSYENENPLELDESIFLDFQAIQISLKEKRVSILMYKKCKCFDAIINEFNWRLSYEVVADEILIKCIKDGEVIVSNTIETYDELGKKMCAEEIEDIKGKINKFITKEYNIDYIIEHLEEYYEVAEKLNEILKKSHIIQYLEENTVGKANYYKKKIKETLFGDSDFTDNNKIIVDKIYALQKEFETKKDKQIIMPNFVIMGGPGTGKTRFIKRLVECFGKKAEDIIYKSPSDFKGAYVGHTASRVFDVIKEADENGKIIFIDEAYNFLGDKFGEEAMDMLLPILSGDRTIISKTNGNSNSEEVYELKNIPCISLAGYTVEMRKMISANAGLYRRLEKITLLEPSATVLFKKLLDDSEERLKRIYKKNEKIIKSYFTWGIKNEYVEYFANYAGVEEFHKICTSMLEENTSDWLYTKNINDVIFNKKYEIKSQYKAIIKRESNIKFEFLSDIETRLSHIKGSEKVVKEFTNLVYMLIKKERYEYLGIAMPKGALLVGPPGTGKTLFARAVAGELQEQEEKTGTGKSIGFVSVSSTELNCVQNIQELFNQAEEYSTCIIFIDEIDEIAKNRYIQGSRTDLLIQLMKELDGFSKRSNIFVLAATNAPHILDPAIKRPGRFDRILEVLPPEDAKERAEVLKFYVDKLRFLHDSDIDIEKLCEDISSKTNGYTQSQLSNLVNEASILFNTKEYIRDERDNSIKLDDDQYKRFKECIDEKLEQNKIGVLKQVNKEKKFSVENNEGCSAIAIHEVGHAMIMVLLKLPTFEKITIIARGNALGYVDSNFSELWTKKHFLDRIKVCLAGRIVEEVVYGRDGVSCGASQDIQNATKLALQMVAVLGMSENIGPVALMSSPNGYLGEENKFTCSDEFRKNIDVEIHKIILEQYNQTKELIVKNKEVIMKLAEELFNKEKLTGEEFEAKFREFSNMIEE